MQQQYIIKANQLCLNTYQENASRLGKNYTLQSIENKQHHSRLEMSVLKIFHFIPFNSPYLMTKIMRITFMWKRNKQALHIEYLKPKIVRST